VVEIPSAIALQLHLLSGSGDRGDDFVAGLNRLGTDLTCMVPSLLGVSLTLVRLGYAVAVTALAPNAESTEAAASLAVPLSSGEPGDELVLQAAEPGAFLLLADDLAGLVGPGSPPLEIDRHLTLSSTAAAASFALVLAELRIVNQAIGVLLDRGLASPKAALADLGSRAAAAETTIGSVSRRLLADLRPPVERGVTDR
jgi:hypothetical protein